MIRIVFSGIYFVFLLLFFNQQLFAEETEKVLRPQELTLQDAVELGLKNNLDIIVEKYQKKIALEKVIEEKGIFDPVLFCDLNKENKKIPIAEVFYPRGFYENETLATKLGIEGMAMTGATYGVDLSFSRSESTSEVQTFSPNYSAYLSFKLTHPLLKDFGIEITKTRIRVAEKGSEISRLHVKNIAIETVMAVEDAYLDLVFQNKNLILQNESLVLARKLLTETMIKVKAGEIAPINIIQAKTGIASREQDVIIAKNELARSENRLRLLLDLADSADGFIPVDMPNKNHILPFLKDCLKRALKSRPDLMAAMLEVEQKIIQERYAKNQARPRLDLIGEYGFRGMSGSSSPYGDPTGSRIQDTSFEGKESWSDAFDGFFSDSGYDFWSVAVKFEVPFGNQRARSRILQAGFDKKRSDIKVKRLENEIRNEVKTAFLDIKTGIKRMDVAKTAVDLAEEQLYYEEVRFRAGESVSYNILKFQKNLTEKQMDELRAAIDYNRALSRLKGAEGESLNEYGIEFE